MTLKSDAKFKEKLTCGFKYDVTNLTNSHPTTQKSEISFQWTLVVQSVQSLSQKNTEELFFVTLDNDAKFE